MIVTPVIEDYPAFCEALWEVVGAYARTSPANTDVISGMGETFAKALTFASRSAEYSPAETAALLDDCCTQLRQCVEQRLERLQARRRPAGTP